jgi:hypothetical protein
MTSDAASETPLRRPFETLEFAALNRMSRDWPSNGRGGDGSAASAKGYPCAALSK